ncbi:hypothetical protein BDR04DRAFT_1162781 [Suillus decipiens]|nr:hypothetical protein BDR04DRAFT_1162781 [Suillus decipiens]
MTYGLAVSRKAVESRNLSACGKLQRHAFQTPAALRNLYIRAIIYSSIPLLVARAFRVPIAGAVLGTGELGYANYKISQLRNKLAAWSSSVQDAAADFIDSASDGIKSLSSCTSAVQLPDIEKRYLFASVENREKRIHRRSPPTDDCRKRMPL